MSEILPVTVPKWGIEMQEGTLVAWRVQPGQSVQKGAEIAEIETEKIVNTLESPADGVMRRQIAAEGDTLAVGALVAVLAAADVTDNEIDAFVAAFKPADASFEPAASAIEAPGRPNPGPTPAAGSAGRLSPVVRRLAERLGVDLDNVTGTGRNGRITKEDVERAGRGESTKPGAPATPPTQKLTSMRKTIARRLQQSKQELPHYYLRVDACLDALAAHRDRNDGASINDYLLRAAALALQQVPSINVHFDGEQIRQFTDSDLSLAVATDAGLITPVLRAAQKKSVAEIAAEAGELVTRARTGDLKREEIEGGTFTVSNLGMFGVKDFTAIINPPQAAILAVGAAEPRVVARDGKAIIATMVTLTLSSDHRIIDGAIAARFQMALKALLEDPERL